MNSRLLMLAVVNILLVACNRGVAIVATNQSHADKQVDVILPRNVRLPHRLDSLQAWDLSNTRNDITMSGRYRYSLKVPAKVDTSRNTLSFNLKSYHEATVVGQPTSLQTIKKTFFVVGTDTLKYKRIAGCWTFTIK
jgi:hypothetical protein